MKSGIKKLRTIRGIILGVALALTLCFVNLYAAPVTVGNFVVDYVISSDWGTGSTINVTLKNNGPAINGWTAGWTFPGNQTITNMWSASYTQSGASVSVKDAGFNASLPSGGSTSFGFNVNYSGTNAAPTSFTVNSSSTTASPTPTSPTPTQQGITVTPTPTSRSTPTTTQAPTPTPTRGGVTATPTISSGGPPYQAENASYGNSAVFENTNGGFNGTGYINFPSSGGYLEFRNVNGGPGGVVTLKFRNALGSSSRTGRIQVNGGTWQNITFDPTGAWTTWTDKQVSVTLNSGTGNIIRLESTGQDLANIDQLDIMTGGSTPTPTTRPATPTATRNATPTPTVRTTPTPTKAATPTPTKAPTSTPSGNYNLVVAKDGSGNYSSVQAAINAVPDNNKSWFKIYIKNGTYREVITVSSTKTYVWLIGQSNTGTILTYNNCSDTAGGTTNSASFFAKASNFKAENLTFENAFDYNNSSYTNKQAAADLTLVSPLGCQGRPNQKELDGTPESAVKVQFKKTKP